MTLFFTFSVFLNKNKGDVTNRGKECQPSVVPLVFRQTIWTNLSISWSKVFDRYRWHIHSTDSMAAIHNDGIDRSLDTFVPAFLFSIW